jgi:hypothetical protein
MIPVVFRNKHLVHVSCCQLAAYLLKNESNFLRLRHRAKSFNLRNRMLVCEGINGAQHLLNSSSVNLPQLLASNLQPHQSVPVPL